jgi:adenylate cyclase
VSGVICLVYNYDYWLVRWLLTKDARLLMNLCEIGTVGRLRRLVRRLPANPRCRFCQIPFAGVGSIVRIPRSTKNPNFCRSCFEALPVATETMLVGVLFADLRGYTAWSETHSPAEAADLLSGFYAIADRVLTRDDAFVEYVGDQVMALYLTIMPSLGDETCHVMLDAAKRLVGAVQCSGGGLPVGVGLNIGMCEVGNFAKGQAKDFTAAGDTVNTAARLQGSAKAHQIVMSESAYGGVGAAVVNAPRATLTVKGKAESLTAYLVDLNVPNSRPEV